MNGDTALHGAALRGAKDIVQFLVDKGAKLDVVNKIGWTPWIIADGVFYPNTYNREPETAALLLKLGADRTAGKRRDVDLPPTEALASSGSVAPAVAAQQIRAPGPHRGPGVIAIPRRPSISADRAEPPEGTSFFSRI